MDQRENNTVVLHEAVWIFGCLIILYYEQWMLRAFLSGDYRYTVISTVLPWLYCLFSSVIVTAAFISENKVLRKYYVPYGYLRSIYLIYSVYLGVTSGDMMLGAVFAVFLLIGLVPLRMVSVQIVDEEYMNAFKTIPVFNNSSPIFPESIQQPKPDPFYTPPPPPTPPVTEPSSDWYCTSCGKLNKAHTRFCGEC